MPVDVEPPALARLLAVAERPRQADWSLRAALVRYAQGHPRRVRDLLDVVRRLEAALAANDRVIRQNGPAIWAAVEAGTDPADEGARSLVELVRAIQPLDALADDLAAWAADRTSNERPDAAVDEVTAAVAHRLDELGIPREERTGPPPRRRA